MTAISGSGSELQYNNRGGFVSIGEVTSIDDPRARETHDVTPLAATAAQQNIAGMRSSDVRVGYNWIADLYSGAVAGTDLIAQMVARTTLDWRRLWPSGLTEDFRAFIGELTLDVTAKEPVTSELNLIVVEQTASGTTDGLHDRQNTGTPTDPTSVAVIGKGLELRASNTSSTTPIIIAEPRRFRLVLGLTGTPDVTHLQSAVIERIPALLTIRCEIEVNLQTAAVASKASHWPETGSDAQPSLYEIYKSGKKTKFQVGFQNEAGTGVGPDVVLWTFNGIIENAAPTSVPGEALTATFSVVGDGTLTEATEAKT